MPPRLRKKTETRLKNSIAAARRLTSKPRLTRDEQHQLAKIMIRIVVDTRALSEDIPSDLIRYVA